MKAVFRSDAAHIEALIDRMNRRTNSVAEVTVSGSDKLTTVAGRTQDVMFIIGEVAASGEDTLVSVIAEAAGIGQEHLALKLVSNENDRRFYLVDDAGRVWASPCTVRSQENHPGWSNKKTRPADLWAAIASDTEQARAEFLIAAVGACQGMTVERLRQLAGGKRADGCTE